MRLYLFLAGLAVLLALLVLATVLWRRFYRDDADNPVRRVFKNSAVPLALRLVVRALDLVFAVILYSLLRTDEIGRYDLAALLVVQYLGTISEFGLGVLLTREVAREPGAAERLFGTTLLLRWLLALAAMPVAGVLIGVYALLGSLGIGEPISDMGQQAIWVLLLTLFPAAYSGAVTALFNANERMEVPALIELLSAVLSMLARVAVLLLGFRIIGLSWAAVAVTTVTALTYMVLQTRIFFRPTLRWDTALARHLAPLALPLMLNNLLNAIFFRFDVFIIKAFGAGQGDTLVTQYNLAYKVLSIPMILPPVVTFAVFPLLARRAAGERAALAQAQSRTLQALLLLAFPITVGICILAPDLVRLFIGRSQDPTALLPASSNVLAILAWFLPFSFVNGLLQYVLIAINQQRSITRAFVVGALFNLAVNLVTIPAFGIYAAGVVTILSEIVLLTIFLPLLRRAELMPPLLTLSWRPLIASLAMGAAMLTVGLLGWGQPGATDAPWQWGRALVMAVVAVPAYGCALWLLGAFGPEERALVRRAFAHSDYTPHV